MVCNSLKEGRSVRMMSFGSVMRATIVVIFLCVPTVLFWLLAVSLIVIAIDRFEVPVSRIPSPAKAPAWELGFSGILVYADPYFAGTIYFYRIAWLALFGILATSIVLWTSGIAQRKTRRASAKRRPSFLLVISVSLVAGLLLATPWIYAVVCILAR
jgi:hypothetical protein